MDYTLKAANAARLIGENFFQAHRGAIPLGDDLAVIFGNDGYAEDSRAQREVEMVRERLREAGVEELGFGLDKPGGYSWALVVKSADVGQLTAWVWEAWAGACGGGHECDGEQRTIAASALIDAAELLAAA